MNKKLLLAAIVLGAGTAAFAANPVTIVYPAGDSNYVGPAGTSIGTYFTQTSRDTVTGGCKLDSSGYEVEPNNTSPHALNIPGLTLDTTATVTGCNITGTPAATTNGTQTYGVENINSTPPGTNYVIGIQITITPTSLTYPQSLQNLTVGVPIAADVPTINSTGVTNPITYSVSPALPAGLSLNTSTGAITGTPTTATATARYTVTASTVGADFNTYTTTAVVGITVQVAANVSAYTHSMRIKLNTTGFTLTGPVTNYPLLVELNNANAPSTDNFDFSQAAASGADIRFTTTRNNVTVNLPYEIEQWAPGTGKTGSAVIWVSVDTMYVNDTTHFINMYWGNALASSASSGPAVFSPYNGYLGAWHMNAGTTGTTAALGAVEPDVTGDNFHAADSGGQVTTSAGFIGLGRGTFGLGDFLRMDATAATPAGYGASVPAGPNSALDFPMFANYTLSAWANPGASGSGSNQYALISKGNQDYQLQTDGANWENTQEIYLKALTSGAYNEYFNNQSVATTTTGWHYVVGESVNATAKAQSQNIYVDGAAVSHANKIYSGGHAPRNNSLYLTIGSYPQAANGPNDVTFWFDNSSGAMLDEISVSNVVRSADWVTLNFQTQCYSNPSYTSLGGTGCTTVAPVSVPMLAAVPNPPTSVTTSAPSSGQITVNWTAPIANGTSAITSYKVTASDTSKHCTATAPAVTCTVTGLTNTTAYTFTVVAINSAGASTASAPSAAATNIFSFNAKNGFGLQIVGSQMLLSIPSVSGDLKVSIIDLFGRTVWSRNVAGNIGQLSWNGKSNGGSSTSAGMYVLRIASENNVGSTPAKAIQTTFVMQ